ncbi:unnamed protein product, partial [Amoebophrya sp. A120]
DLYEGDEHQELRLRAAPRVVNINAGSPGRQPAPSTAPGSQQERLNAHLFQKVMGPVPEVTAGTQNPRELGGLLTDVEKNRLESLLVYKEQM